MELDIQHLQTWVNKEIRVEESISVTAARLMAATLNQNTNIKKGDPLPLAWHWLYFHEPVETSGLGEDGHAKRGGFLPPVPLPRRMWAGGRLTFSRPIRIGDQATKRSMIKSVTEKRGRSGQLCFVVVEHQITVDGDVCLTEEQNLVYREAPKPGTKIAAKPAPTDSQWSEMIEPSSVLLFRYSALTFNGHRIHYDKDYCRDVEGYPGLVVHGPLIATMLLDLVYRHCPDSPIINFDFRAMSPLFDISSFTIHGLQDHTGAQAWAANEQGGLAMKAEIGFGKAA